MISGQFENSNVIITDNLSKVFDSRGSSIVAVDDVTFTVKRGDIFGFLGPNGAGKTTTIKMITGALSPTSGTAVIEDYDIVKNPLNVKKRIGVMPEEPGFYGNMTGREHLEFYSDFYYENDYRDNIEPIAERVGIIGYIDRKVKEYSHGMKKRLALAQALVHEPSVLMLDEPTMGLDPEGTHFFRNFIKELNEKGKTIFLSSHVLSEVQQVCNRVGIIHNGEILRVDTIEDLSDELFKKKGFVEIDIKVSELKDTTLREIKGLSGVKEVVRTDEGINVHAQDEALSKKINSILVNRGAELISVNIEKPDLEDIFLDITRGGKDE